MVYYSILDYGILWYIILWRVGRPGGIAFLSDLKLVLMYAPAVVAEITR